MSQKQETKQMIMEAMKILALVDTEQIARFCHQAAQPNKRASEYLKELEREKWVKGQRRLEKPKVWWLTKRGCERMEKTYTFKRPDSLMVDHSLEIGNVFFDLLHFGECARFEFEPRYTFRSGAEERVYMPDAFFVWRGKPYLMEVQRSPMTARRWAEKHAVLEALINSGAYKECPFWAYGAPRPLILTGNQQEATIQAGTNIPYWILRNMEELLDK